MGHLSSTVLDTGNSDLRRHSPAHRDPSLSGDQQSRRGKNHTSHGMNLRCLGVRAWEGGEARRAS